MIFSSKNPPGAVPVQWYQRALVYVGFTVVIIAVFLALIAIGGETGLSLQQRLWQGVGLLVASGLVAGGYLTLVRAEAATSGKGDGTGDGVVPATIVFDAVCFTVGGLVIVSFANPANPRQWAATIMWALACLAIGAIGGFLFGIPRSRRESRPTQAPPPSASPVPSQPAPANPKTPKPALSLDQGVQPEQATTVGTNVPPDTSTASQSVGAATTPPPASAHESGAEQAGSEVPTQDASSVSSPDLSPGSDPSPIEQISDWLTKIIVGLGLANLKALPGQLDAWARYVAMSIGSSAIPPGGADGSGASLALGMILYFLILGFMACYILTQIFLRNLVNKSNN
jgi:hypothetical protein